MGLKNEKFLEEMGDRKVELKNENFLKMGKKKKKKEEERKEGY